MKLFFSKTNYFNLKKKRGKSRRRSKTSLNHGPDRISSLPDVLLIHVFSFVPATNDAIRTSILSKRWKYLWTCMPNYSFKYTQFCKTGYSKGAHDSWVTSFIDSMDRLFKLCDPGLCIKKFRLPIEFDAAKMKAWMECLVSHNIQQLEIKTQFFKLPKSLLTCKTLIDLKLPDFFKLTDVPTIVSLPNLKTLHIDLTYYTNQAISAFLYGCPVLEELYLDLYVSYTSEDLEVLNISVPSLKKLSIYSDTHFYDFAIIIVAPLLEYFDLDNDKSSHISLNTMPSLVEAHLNVLALKQTDQLWKLLWHISDIKCLTIPARTIEYLGSVEDVRHLPQFPKMELLTIGRDYGSFIWNYAHLPNLLDRMPKLNHIVFKKERVGEPPKFSFSRRRQDSSPVCLKFHLKTIKFYKFYGTKADRELVKYFLENAKVLESMTIHIGQYYVGDILEGLELNNTKALEKVTVIRVSC